MLPSTVGAQEAVELTTLRYAAATKGNYQRLWEQFEAYCQKPTLPSLPAAPSTVASYLGYLFRRGTVRGSSIRHI